MLVHRALHTSLAHAVTAVLLVYFLAAGTISLRAQADNTSQYVQVASVVITGNDKTREQIIKRELLLVAGQKFSAHEFSRVVNQTRLNLLNTSLFNFVTIDTIPVPGEGVADLMDIKISLIERWYIWPVPILQITDRNFNAWVKTRDFTRLNYGLDTKWFNFTGRMDELDAKLQFGKNYELSLAYSNPYLDKKKHFGMGFAAGYKRNRETGYITTDDKLQYAFVPDGLSSEKFISVTNTYRKNIFTTHQLTIGFRALSFSDSLLKLNSDYSYPSADRPVFLNLYYKVKIDHRDIKYYPLTGWYADVELNKSGLGFGFEQPVDVAWAKTTTRYYCKLASRWYSGLSFIGKVSSGSWQPYFLMQALGYNRDYVRGYEYNVIDGKHFALVRSNIKFALVPEQSSNISFIPTPKFGLIHYALYLTAFADAGYVWQPQWIGEFNNKLPATMLVGAGLGLDLVTYYDKVVRFEYAVNKSGKSGIFIHFIAGI